MSPLQIPVETPPSDTKPHVRGHLLSPNPRQPAKLRSDNVSTHKAAAIQRWLVRHPRFSFHFTPTCASWMNLVERWFSELTTKWIRRGAHTSVKDLTDSIQQWTDNWNHNPRPFTWHKSADDIFETMASYLQRIPQSGY
ncbi:MAG: transposase [Acidimicrobiaceae bacterium]|nr:transposase [Acidimicrobiaceae bacterium]